MKRSSRSGVRPSTRTPHGAGPRALRPQGKRSSWPRPAIPRRCVSVWNASRRRGRTVRSTSLCRRWSVSRTRQRWRRHSFGPSALLARGRDRPCDQRGRREQPPDPPEHKALHLGGCNRANGAGVVAATAGTEADVVPVEPTASPGVGRRHRRAAVRATHQTPERRRRPGPHLVAATPRVQGQNLMDPGASYLLPLIATTGACVRRGGDDAPYPGVDEAAPPHPSPGLSGIVLGGDVVHRVLPIRQRPTQPTQTCGQDRRHWERKLWGRGEGDRGFCTEREALDAG